MIFSSWQFLLVFLPIAVLGFFAIPAGWEMSRKLWLDLYKKLLLTNSVSGMEGLLYANTLEWRF